MSLTREKTGTRTFLEQVIRVTRDVQVDLLRIAQLYPRQLSEEKARQYINDFRVLMDEELLEQIEFEWVRAGSYVVLDALRYKVHNGKTTVRADRPGGFQYDSVVAIGDFHVLTWRDWGAFNALPLATRADITRRLRIAWSPAADRDYSLGSWSGDKSFVQPDISIQRQRFLRR
jgi:hypothetical protein